MTKQPGNSLIGGVGGMKAFSLGDLDNWMDWQNDNQQGTAPQDLYAAVAWVFWCVNLRANAVSSIPYGIYPKGTKESDWTEDNEVEFDIDLTQYLWSTEAWLLLKAAAYWLKRKNSTGTKQVQILNSNSMKVWRWDADGPTVFRQTVGADHIDYPADAIVYFRTFNPKDDIREGVASGRVSALPALLIKHVNEWAEAFFRNGAVPLTLLMSDKTIPIVEQDRIRATWRKLYQGFKRAFNTAIIQMGMKVEVIGQPIKDLAMPEMEVTKKHQILAAHLIPPGYAEAKTNRAERWALQAELYIDAIVPECKNHLVPVINEQLLDEFELQIGFRYNEIESLQRAEIEKAESAAFYVTGVASTAYNDNVISVKEYRGVVDTVLTMGSMPGLDHAFTPEERMPVLPAGGADNEGRGSISDVAENIQNRSSPKALAPGWGHLRASLGNLADGETRQASGESPATLTVT